MILTVTGLTTQMDHETQERMGYPVLLRCRNWDSGPVWEIILTGQRVVGHVRMDDEEDPDMGRSWIADTSSHRYRGETRKEVVWALLRGIGEMRSLQ